MNAVASLLIQYGAYQRETTGLATFVAVVCFIMNVILCGLLTLPAPIHQPQSSHVGTGQFTITAKTQLVVLTPVAEVLWLPKSTRSRPDFGHRILKRADRLRVPACHDNKSVGLLPDIPLAGLTAPGR